jgi:hypothetical protein
MDQTVGIVAEEGVYADETGNSSGDWLTANWLSSTLYQIRFDMGRLPNPPSTFEYSKVLSHLRTLAGVEYDSFGPISLTPY